MTDFDLDRPAWASSGGDYARPGDASVLARDPAFGVGQGTLAFVMTADGIGARQGLISKDARGFESGGHLSILVERDGSILFRLQSETGEAEIRGGMVTPGQAQHVAVTFGDAGMTLYVDGAAVGSHDFSGGLSDNGELLVIGANNWSSTSGTTNRLKHPFKGTIEDVQLYDVAATPAQIDALAARQGDGKGDPSPANAAPGIAPGIVDATIDVASKANGEVTVDLDDFFEDPDGDALTLELRDAPDWGTLTPQGLRLSPGADAQGTHMLDVRAFDGRAHSEYLTMQVKVSDMLDKDAGGAGLWSADGYEGSRKDDVVTLDHDPAWKRSEGTVALSFTADELSRKQGLISKDARDFGDGGHLMIILKGDKIEARLQSDTGSGTIIGGRVTEGREHDVALSFGADGMTLWLDGEKVGSNDFAGGLQNNEEKIVVGANNWRSTAGTTDNLKHVFNGSIDDVQIFAPLSDSEIRALHGDGTGTEPPSDDTPAEPEEKPAEPDRKPAEPDRKPAEPDTPPAKPDTAPPVEPDNAAPVALVDSFSRSMVEGQRKGVDLVGKFMDMDGDTLVFKLADEPDWADVSGDTLRLRPGSDDAGTHTMRVQAFDGEIYSGFVDVRVDVADNGEATGGGSGGGSLGKTVTLVAEENLLSGPVGRQLWGDGVTLAGYDLAGRAARVAWGDQHRDDSYGVKGGRWDGQIDFSEKNGGTSEKLVIDFGGAVTDVVLDVALMGLNEGPRVNGEKASETGKWTAYDDDGRVVDSGLIGPELSMLGRDVAYDKSYGTYPIDIDAEAYFSKLAIEATQFEHGAGYSVDNRRYGENSSDIAVAEVTYTRVEDYDFM